MKKVKEISLFIEGAMNLPDGRLALMYVVLKAVVDKDKLAAELLEAAGYKMYDTDGNLIFPVPSKQEVPDGTSSDAPADPPAETPVEEVPMETPITENTEFS